jgi:2-methylcitrate dehydratase PrpD
MAEETVTETLASRVEEAITAGIPDTVREVMRSLLIDVAGLCVAARGTDYVAGTLAAADEEGPCTAIGHPGGRTAAAAAIINGTAAHGEDYDDTFEGGPVHSGAVIVPAVLVAAERHGRSGADVLGGIAVGTEILCRLSLVVPKAVHKAGFHPTAVFGAVAAAGAVGVTLGLPRRALVSALGIAGSMASGIIEYLAEGTWTKRLHPGWAAQSGYRAARLAAAGFAGPGTVLEGTHGLFNGFARTTEGDWDALNGDFGRRWVAASIAFKPYPCGTMTHPYIDCARRLAGRGIKPEQIEDILCETAEGYVHRLWEPLEQKQNPANGYAAKFSVPYAVAAGLILGEAGLSAFEDETVRDARLGALARKVRYVIDPDNPYPRAYTGHLRVTLKSGEVIEERQPHLRGGVAEPLTPAEIEAKFRANCRHGGWDEARAEIVLGHCRELFSAPRLDLTPLRG